jgi:hypothetical protein
MVKRHLRGERKNLRVINDLLEFCNSIGTTISSITEIGLIDFQRIKINSEGYNRHRKLDRFFFFIIS